MEYCNADRKIIKKFDKYKKTDAFTVDFRLSVPAKGMEIIFLYCQKQV